MLETAANPFMAQFGPAETSERRLNFAQSFNPPGTIVGVIIGARFIFSGIEKSAEVAPMQAAGTYARTSIRDHARSADVSGVGLSRTVVRAAVIADEVSVDARSMRARPEIMGALVRCCTIRISVRCRGELLQCGRTDLVLEQPDPVHEAIHECQREDRGSLPYGFAGRDYGRTICDYAVDEIFPAD